jgi:antitoxin FitA
MSKMIQLRHVPEALHRRLKARAAQEGMTLSDFLIREVRKVAERPSNEEIAARLASRPPVVVSETSAQAVRAERDARDAR